jgi:pimeloyl-ACP methyl ester carboxylesterase
MASREILYKDNLFDISYEILNRDKKNDFIVLHGWGSNKEIMEQAFSKTLHNFRHIYIDLPGFGNSSNDTVLNSIDYRNIIEQFLEQTGCNKDIVLGHSFGGKIATLLNPKLLVLLSSAGIVTKKPLSTKVKIFTFKFLKKLGFGKAYKLFATKDVNGMSKIMYETLKNVVNEDFNEDFSRFSNNTLIFWGKSDRATPLSSGKKISGLIKNSKFYEIDGDHFFFIKNSLFIAKQIEVNIKCM